MYEEFAIVSRAMTFPEFRHLMQHIDMEHSVIRCCPAGNKKVKYVDPHFDMRTGTCFAITFRGFGWDKVLHTQNEEIDNPKSLYDRCMDFLDGKEESAEA